MFGFDDLAGSLYDAADEHYDKAGKFYDDFNNTYTGDEYGNIGIDTDRFNYLIPEHIKKDLARGIFRSPHSKDTAVTTAPIPADLGPNIGFMGEGDIASDEINALIEAAKGARARSGPEDRGALGRQYRDEKAAAQARADQAIDKKMNADAAAVAEPTAEQMFKAGMDDFLAGIRGTGPNVPKARSLEDYKKEFADATGLDISGDVDKSQALMAFGLALMQNKAKGKGIGGMLDALGAAGTAAMPALSEARKEARANAAAAGKYALEMRSADQAKREAAAEKSLQRQAFYVLPRGKSTADHVANIIEGTGRREYLNAYELNAAITNPDFSNQYDIIPVSQYDAVVAEAMKTPEAQETHQGKPRQLVLYKDTDAELTLDVYDPVGSAAKQGVKAFAANTDAAYDRIADQLEDLDRADEEWARIMSEIDQRGVNVFTQSSDAVESLFEAFGVNFREGETPTARMRNFLNRMKAQNAPEILGEAGKTISDADRERVAEIVGEVSLLTSQDDLMARMNEVHNFIVNRARTNVTRALREVDRYSLSGGFSQYVDTRDGLDEDAMERLRSYDQKYGYGAKR